MTNETISFDEFAERFGTNPSKMGGSYTQEECDRANTLAWEECAWIATLTFARATQALDRAFQTINQERA